MVVIKFLIIFLALEVAGVHGSVCSYGCSQRYTTSCGFWGGSRCTRYRDITCYKCCVGWQGDVGANCPTPICFGSTTCQNGGTCTNPDYCSYCNRGYYSPRCNLCTQIDNCLAGFCSNMYNQKCDNCDGEYGASFGYAYKKSDDQTQCNKQCSWRTDSNACYPGSCLNGACTCTAGFSGTDCRTMGTSQAPVLSEHLATLRKGTTTLESPTVQGSTDTVYTNIRDFTEIQILTKSSYQPTHLPALGSGHPYIDRIRLGVVSATASAVVNRATTSIYAIGTTSSCSTGSRDNPVTALSTCDHSFTINYSSWTPATGDILRYDVTTVSGGHMRLYDRDNSDSIMTRYYTGSTTSGYSTFTFDFDDPYHCVDVVSGCRTTMLHAGDDVTSQAMFTVTWEGWVDNLSGIKEFNLQVIQLSGSHGNHMTEIFDSPPVFSNTTESGQEITLPQIGVYSIVLTAVDNGGNTRLARRFVFLDDDQNDVTIQGTHPLRVLSATTETNFEWITSLDTTGGTTSVPLDWASRFINLHHYNQGLLKPIGDWVSGSIDVDYDQYFGKRGRAAIPNALGITQFRVFSDIDHRGGRSIVNASDDNADHWSNEASNTQATYDLNLIDGDSIRFWVEARDIAGHFVRDTVLVHADSSPPIIEDFWLVRGDDVNIAVHNSVDLHDLSVEFRTYDIHSGVRTIEWRLFDNHTGSEVEHGSQTVAAVKVDKENEDCDPVTCMCVPGGDCYNVDYGFKPTFHIGVHDFDYYIMLTVTNHARLVTSQTIKITVDTSPPQAGVVHDGMPGSGEVDFQEGNDLAAHWEGFFDRESGVKFYEYLYDVTCWNDADMVPSIRDTMTRTTVTHASWTAPSPGMYFITVIAYNRALEPSVPICSDGVMIDTSPPELSNISISDSRMRPGLAKDSEGRVWFINEHRMKTELLNVSDMCRSKVTVVSDITLYPGQGILNDSVSVIGEDINCQWTSGIEEKFFLPTHKHIILSWSGSDEDSSIFDYEIGLSSDPSNPTPDLVTFMSASGHNRFVMYHPHISQGNVFFLVVKAVNKAQLAHSKFVGPIIVDTTPPMFVGRILVHLDGEYLVTEWGADGFTDNEDAGLSYQVCIGHTRGGTEFVSYRSQKEYVIGPCESQTFCAAFLLDDLSWYLHGDHEYYISVKAENSAGLSTVGTSSVYRHIVQLPSQGVVLDVPPSGEGVDFGVVKDTDVQMDQSKLSAQWFGFEHPHLDINYEVAVGTGEDGSYGVSNGFIDVGNATSYELDGLDLTPLMTYYLTVRATSETGSVIVTSDGIKVIPEGQLLEGALIKDGLGCDPANITTPTGLSHHATAPSQPCEDDITYQPSTSGISARWSIPVMLRPFVTNVLWAVEHEILTRHDVDNSSSEWVTLLDYQDLGMAFNHLDVSLGLHDGARLRSKVQFCHGSVCFQPMISDGFWVLSQPPVVGDVTINDIETDSTSTNLHVAFQTFEHAYIDHDRQLELMDFYEWTIAEKGEHSAILSEWKRIDDLNIIGETARFTASLDGQLDHDTCLRMAVRGYNKAGLSSIVSTEVVDCDDVVIVKPHVVIDSDHEVNLEQNALWLEADANYISSTTVLSAVWPSLRHRNYVWAAVKDTGSADFGDLDIGLNYPCEHPMAVGCGNTDKEFVNVHGLSLEHGERYRICIHADEVTLEHEKWSEALPSVSSCSDGVVIDTTPPTPGSVWIGWSSHNNYQSSTSELVIQWESFSDVEEHGLARHHSGVKYYEYAIGSMPGGNDVQDFTRVGIANSIIIHNLRLQNGHAYYAVIRATDFVGLSTKSSSDAIMIDTTSPTVSDVYTLDIGGSFLMSTTSVSPSWENVFSDVESGISYFEWAVGSHPGHADVMPFTREDSESGVTDPSQPLTLHEGHSYFISIKAINHVGLITLKAFGAFTVDESPPVAGHVFDGDRSLASSNHRDRDFQEDRKTISAFWEGFHDPHSALIGYSWRAGTCKGCSDVISEQNIGMDTEVKADNLNLVPGFTYYVTVTACNAADLCTSVTSDGVLVDDSPPLVGRVYDGSPGGGDISFQSSRRQLSAHWWGFHDPHSSLSHYEWRAGTTPGSADILSSTRIELSQSALMFLSESDQMLENTDIYITVRAYNGLGMWSESTSNGFRVDSSPPEVIQEPTIDGTVGVVVRNTQVLCDVIRFVWKFVDVESGITDQYVSVSTHHNGDVNIPTIKIAGSEVDHTFTNLTLHEGSRYVITVVACNQAGLCTEAKSAEFLVDCSSPTVGTFAVETESAANLERHHIIWITPTEQEVESTASPEESTEESTDPTSMTTPRPLRYHSGWMTWLEDPFTSTGSLALAWLGFADLHSGISHYFVSVGRTYGGSELTPSGPVRVNHSSDGMSLDEGIAQTAIIPVEGSITDSNNHYLYVSVWAVNGVGLPSSRRHSTFEVSETSPDEGALVLVRRCQAATCEGHCACAPIHGACSTAQGLCSDLTIDNPNTEIEVIDVIDLNFDDINNLIDIDGTPTQYMMAAAWRVSQQKGLSINWYEWSIGDDSSSDVEPTGVFDSANERVWFDIGQENHTIVVLDKDRILMTGLSYHFYIRAWYSATSYAKFRSDGVTPDIKAPKISKVRGTKIKDLATEGSTEDTDYVTNPVTLYVSWEGVFRDDEISQYEVSLSTFKGGEDISHFADKILTADVVTTQFTGLGLQSGNRYYSNVRAINKAGLRTLRSSDGFVVDLRQPDAGLVFDGIDLHDLEYQNSSTVISASWHGFTDLESYIDHYEWCVGRSPDSTDHSVLQCTDVGMRLSASKMLEVPLTGGIRYYSIVSAIDAAGTASEQVFSDGVVVDVTPPEPQNCIHSGDNLIVNPSFEGKNEPDIQEPMSTQMTEAESTDNSSLAFTTDSPVADSTTEDEAELNDNSSPALTTESAVESTTSSEEDSESPQDEIAPWELGSGAQITVITHGKKIARDGRSFLSLQGSISQTFNSTPGSHYRVLFFTSHVVPSHEPLLNQEGRIEAPGLNRVFRLYSRPAGSHSNQNLASIQWHEQRFYFTASEALSTLRVSSVGRSNGILLDNIQVTQITTEPSSGQGSVDVHTQFIHSWSSLQAKWHFVDTESPIIDYNWAIGTSSGGTQLQNYKSVGTQTNAINTELTMSHGSFVYVTVTAKNAADLISVVTSDPVLIDLTTPIIHSVRDGGSEDDIDFSSDDKSVSFSWSASDPESGIDHCEWAIGLEPGLDDVIPSTVSPNSESKITANLARVMVEGQKLFATVKCFNNAGRSSWKSSDGVTIVTEPPSSLAAVVKVKAVSDTAYATLDGYQSQNSFLKASWEGFMDPFGIQFYQCRLTGPSYSPSPWTRCGSASEEHLNWSDLTLEDDATYSLSVRAVNHADLISQTITQNVTVETSRPTSQGSNLLITTWQGNGTLVDLTWDEMFMSSSPMFFEVSLGTVLGGSDVMQWIETMDTGMRVSPLVPHTDYYLTVTAVNAAGLPETVNVLINHG
ncbi:uncharacterized protein [Asterias amurensis]|uniref:uncharacterized protein isoform X2 n=1 Tax=Asterias amurensis TaxID=7602 RepID=UPI003AB551AB